ncbi:MAG: DUF115 domain-containing protein [Spirochaetales bacterium]|nr:DUF115 domain-containing protein [Spirochaetales bacterium]
MDTESPVLIDTGSGYTLKYKGKYLYSSMQPESLVNKRVERLQLSEKTLVFIPSLGLGYGINSLLEKLPLSSHIIVVEADQALFHFAAHQKKVPIPSHKKVTLVRTESIHELINLVAALGFRKFRKVSMCILSGGFHFFKQLYEEMFHSLEKEIQQYWKNKMTFIHMAPLWIKNIFLNLPVIHDACDSSTLKTDMPVVVAGAGPSLEESIAIIKKVRNKVILLVVDTAFPFFYHLWEHGEIKLLPDFVFILESQIVNLKDFVSCKNPGIPCICDITSHPGVMRLFTDKKYLFASRFSDIKLFDRLEKSGLLPMQFPALGSVGVAALYAALHLTSGPIFVTGLDFGYSEHMTHCRGTAHYHYFESLSSRLTPLESLVSSAIAARPLVRKKGKQDKIVLTDLILSTYAGQIPGIVGDRGGVYDIGKHGLDLGLPGVNEEAVAAIIGEGEKFKQPGPKNTTGFTSMDQLKAMEFLIKEKEYIDECRTLITPLIKEAPPGRTDFSRGEHTALVDLDYSYLHFPDQTALPVYDPNFLLRVLISLEHYEKVLTRALQQCPRGNQL